MAKSNHPLARFFIPMDEARERLEWLPLQRAQRELCLRGVRDGDVCAWIDGPWPLGGAQPAVTREPYPLDFEQKKPGVALVVLERPIASKRSISVCYEELFGFREDRLDATTLFLGEVWARDVNMVPNNVAVFAAGLRVQRLALFDGMESRASIDHVLEAPLVISGFRGGIGGVTLRCQVSVGAYAGWIENLPERAARHVYDGVHQLLPFFEAHGVATSELEDGVFPWAIFEQHYKNRAFPRSFVLPTQPPFRSDADRPKAPRKKASTEKKPAPAKTMKSAPTRKKHATPKKAASRRS